MQIVLNDGFVVAYYTDDIPDVTLAHPGCEVVSYPHNFGPYMGDGPVPDPRTPEEKAADEQRKGYSAILARHAQEEQQGVTLTSGIRMRYAKDARDNYKEILDAIVLLGTARTYKLWDADGGLHDNLTADQAKAILMEYAGLVATQRERQMAELFALLS